MRPAAEKLALELERLRFSDPRPPVMSNVEAAPIDRGARLSELLARQVTAPVRFTDMITGMRDSGVTRFLEVGPGRVLTGLVGRIAGEAHRANLGCVADLDDAARFVAAEAA
jgi:[acyl-carrier-protein] S-malonyltransferase